MKTYLSVIKAHAKDIAARALHTLWQFFAAALVATWTASGIDVSQIVDVDSAKRFAIAAFGAVVAASLSAVKSTVGAIRKDPTTYLAKHEAGHADAGVLVWVIVVVLLVLIFLKVFALI